MALKPTLTPTKPSLRPTAQTRPPLVETGAVTERPSLVDTAQVESRPKLGHTVAQPVDLLAKPSLEPKLRETAEVAQEEFAQRPATSVFVGSVPGTPNLKDTVKPALESSEVADLRDATSLFGWMK